MIFLSNGIIIFFEAVFYLLDFENFDTDYIGEELQFIFIYFKLNFLMNTILTIYVPTYQKYASSINVQWKTN